MCVCVLYFSFLNFKFSDHRLIIIVIFVGFHTTFIHRLEGENDHIKLRTLAPLKCTMGNYTTDSRQFYHK